MSDETAPGRRPDKTKRTFRQSFLRHFPPAQPREKPAGLSRRAFAFQQAIIVSIDEAAAQALRHDALESFGFAHLVSCRTVSQPFPSCFNGLQRAAVTPCDMIATSPL
jgi:hypothetical protein